MSAPADLASYLRAAVLTAGALCAPLAAAQSLTLSAPYRGALSMQTAATTIEFDASNIAAGATIDAGGGPISVPASPCAGVACSGAGSTPAGDDILVTRISGTNRAQLQLTYFPSFDSSGGSTDFCQYIGPASTRTFTITLSGFSFLNAGNGYRITSFAVPSCLANDIPYVRVAGGNRPTLSGGGLNKIGRLPLNLVLVLDKSPSMGWKIDGTTPSPGEDSRWDLLKHAVQQFAAVWDVVGAAPPPGTVSSEGHPDDRLGLLFFGSTVSESPLDGVSFFKSRGTSAAPWSASVSSALTDGFIGGTSVGAGAANARTQLNTVAKVTGDTAIVLFTDGEQNSPPCIIHDGETPSPTTKPYPNLPGVTYLDQCTIDPGSANPTGPPMLNSKRLAGGPVASRLLPQGPIFTVGIGEAAHSFLDDISNQTAGTTHFAYSGSALDTSLVDTLVDNLKGGTVSLLERVVDTMPVPGATPPMSRPMPQATPPIPVIVDPSLTRVVFVLGWDGGAREMDLEIRQPNGTVVQPTLREGTPNSRVAAVNLPSNGPSGTWSARAIWWGGSPPPFRYHLSAYGVESRLSARVSELATTGTGQPINIVAEVGWGDEGLPNLPSGAIRAFIERPPENLGNILHDSKVQEQARPTESSASLLKDTSPLMVKIAQLARSAKLLDRIQPRALSTPVELVSVGNGRYEGTFKHVNVGGKYRIRVEFNWNDSRTGQIKRTHIAERQVPVVPSAADSLVQVQRDAADVQVLVTPKDAFGNFVGPGYKNRFNVQVTGVKVPPANDPNITGAYGFQLRGLPPGADPKVEIAFGGQTIRSASLSTLEAAPPRKCGCFDVKCKASLANAMASLGTLGGGVAIAGLMAYLPLRRRKDK